MSPGEGPRFADDAERYRLESRIATGGMGEVWRATDTLLNREVAVKLLKSEYADDATFRSRFETEARNAAALHHPGVASVFDYGTAAPRDGSGIPRPFLVMELVRGEPLSDLLRAGRPMPPEAARDLIGLCADAIAAAHAAGIVHRDVKPANLLVTPDRKVKITDFGIARAGDEMALTQTGQVIGTPQYFSPEQAQGKPATKASDVYSLGVVLFECLAGRRPFGGDSPVATALAHLREPVPDLPAEVPRDLAAVVHRSLAKDPAERYADAQAFAVALRDPATPATVPAVSPAVPPVAAAPTMVEPVPAPTPDRDRPRRRRVPAALVIAGAAVAVLLLLVGVVALTGDDPAGETPDGADASASASADSGAGADTTADAEPSEEPTPEPSDTTSEEPTQEPTEEPTEEPVEVDEDDYLGDPADQAAFELESLGLATAQETEPNPGTEEEGTVSGVDPTGSLEPGATVTLSVWDEAPLPEETESTAPPGPPESETPGNSTNSAKPEKKDPGNRP